MAALAASTTAPLASPTSARTAWGSGMTRLARMSWGVTVALCGLSSMVSRLYVPNHYWYFTPATLVRLIESVGLRVVLVRGESPYLGRYSFSLPVRAGLATLIALGRLTGREARIEIYAVKPA